MSAARSVGCRCACRLLRHQWPALDGAGAAAVSRASVRPGGVLASWQPCAGFSTSASRAARKKRNKPDHHRFARVPDRFLRQKEGDFPVQLRPEAPPEIRDLPDIACDEEAAGGAMDRIRSPKPHKVREGLRERFPHVVGTVGDNVRVKALENPHAETEISRVPKFDLERDLNEEDAAHLAAQRARELAKRNYKWMPNPYSDKPGPLGTSPEAEKKYHARYFDGRRLAEDKTSPGGSMAGAEELKDGRVLPRRKKVYPKRFWYAPDHVTPDVHTVHFMKTRELKFAMVNEAHLVRKWRTGHEVGHADGRAAGMPPGSTELWMAFGYRAAELARGLPLPSPDPPHGDGDQGDAPEVEYQRCSLSSALRFLQAIASVQAGPYSAVQTLVERALEHRKELKPRQCFYLLQALSRLRFRQSKTVALLERMSLSWSILPPKKLVQAANAVAKLDLGGNIWAKPLKLALASVLPHLSGWHLANLKSIAVMEILDDPKAMQMYLKRCEETRSYHRYSRHLQVVELHVHLLHPELWASLDEGVRLFLQELRTASEKSGEAGAGPGVPAPGTRGDIGDHSSGAEDSDGFGSDTSDDDDDRGSQGDPWKKSFDRHRFSSAFHQDVSRVLGDVLGVDHNNQLAAGPMTLDICHLPTMTVVEIGAPWQFYLRSSHVTALARRRQELLVAMGFRLVKVPYNRWDVLESDEDKAAFLRDTLPSDILSGKSRAAGVGGSTHMA